MAYMALATLQQARQAFFDRHELPVGQVTDTILKSWIRCAESGLHEGQHPAPEAVNPALEDRHDLFRRTCAPEIEALYAASRDMDAIVVLADAQGRILDVLGDNSFAGKVKSPSLSPGMDWSERVRGTNGIGTPLIEKRAVCITGPEHFLRAYAPFSCAGVPVLDLQGQVRGVVNLTTPAQIGGQGALGMVRLAVEQIEHHLALSNAEGCDRLRFHTRPEFIGTVREGILTLRDGWIAGGNRSALALIGHSWSDLENLRFEAVFETVDADDTHLRSPSGKDFSCVWERTTARSVPADTHSLAEIEETVMRRVLEAHHGNISAAARHLGVHRSTLYRRLKAA